MMIRTLEHLAYAAAIGAVAGCWVGEEQRELCEHPNACYEMEPNQPRGYRCGSGKTCLCTKLAYVDDDPCTCECVGMPAKRELLRMN